MDSRSSFDSKFNFGYQILFWHWKHAAISSTHLLTFQELSWPCISDDVWLKLIWWVRIKYRGWQIGNFTTCSSQLNSMIRFVTRHHQLFDYVQQHRDESGIATGTNIQKKLSSNAENDYMAPSLHAPSLLTKYNLFHTALRRSNFVQILQTSISTSTYVDSVLPNTHTSC
jgi:hypothetical protein